MPDHLDDRNVHFYFATAASATMEEAVASGISEMIQNIRSSSPLSDAHGQGAVCPFPQFKLMFGMCMYNVWWVWS